MGCLIVEFILLLGQLEMAFFTVSPTQTGFGDFAIVIGRLFANDTQPILASNMRYSRDHFTDIFMDQIE